MRFKYTDGRDSDFILLCRELDHFLNILAGGEENRSQYIPLNSLQDIHDVIIAYDDDTPVGCASFKQLEEDTAEVKRVFVEDSYRGQGISKELMRLLEKRAKEKGYSKFILESGEPLTAAMGLYRSLGYKVIPNYGEYKCMRDSICMSKDLNNDIAIEIIDATTREKSLALVLSVFLKYEAPDYSEQGIQTFMDFINNKEAIDGLKMYGAFKGSELVGVIATRNGGNHIALFFVEGKYHRQGIGRKLFETVLKASTGEKITVNSSPYAVEAYRKLGFEADSEERLAEGMRYTPMTYLI